MDRKCAIHFHTKELTLLMELYAKNYSSYHGCFTSSGREGPVGTCSRLLPSKVGVGGQRYRSVEEDDTGEDDFGNVEVVYPLAVFEEERKIFTFDVEC
ncbi:unnamed protein product [Nippostrongylus brasiliensis]|uniref:Uncharacterized protein n=1 Tax=Nippostrongylus brasiliensis TaxID=27835 RepID=A0A0N4XZC6_NIPBR|nr:unnamed protein product [Nippostrongylus brasiliensis]